MAEAHVSTLASAERGPLRRVSSRVEANANDSSSRQSSSSAGKTLTPTSSGSDSDIMDPSQVLNAGCLQKAIAGTLDVEQPVVQIVQIKPMNSSTGAGVERWRVVVNDSVHFMQSMLHTDLNSMIHSNELQKGVIVRLTNFQVNYIKNKHILVITSVDVLSEYGIMDKIGMPENIENAAGAEETKQEQPGNIASNNFYGNQPQQPRQQPQQQQQQRALPSRGGGGSSHGNITPIEALSPYTHKWSIKARCTHKSEIKHWHKTNSEGKLFSVNFLDESGEIRATGFNDAVDIWYDVLVEGGVYYIHSPCKVQMAKKQFSNVNHDYELTFEKDTLIEKAEDTEGVPSVQYNFTTLEALQNVVKDHTIDCIGILQDVGETQEIVSKGSGKPYNKRELTLVDNTGYSVRLTIWGKTAQDFDGQPESVIAFKNVKVSDFGGRSLSLLSSGSINIDPDIEQAYQLKGWYDGAGRNEQFQSHANTMSSVNATSGGDRNAAMTIQQIKDDNIGMSEEAQWFTVKASIIYIKQDNFAYPACRTEQPQPCNKKVTETGENEWRCEKCDKTWDRPDYRYIMSVNVSDHTGQIWLSCFNETGQVIMGMSANELMAMREEGDDRKVDVVFQEAMCKTFNFRCKAKMDNFQDQTRVRYQVQYANPLNFANEANKLAAIIKQYSIASDSLFVT